MESNPITPYLVGGGLTIAGIMISQFFGLFSGWIDRKHQTALRKKQRLEKMSDLIAETQTWIQALYASRNIEQYREACVPIQVRQVVMLARLSFPSIAQAAREWSEGCLQHYCLLADHFRPDVPATMGAQLVIATCKNPKLQSKAEEIVILRSKLDNAIVEEAKKYQDV